MFIVDRWMVTALLRNQIFNDWMWLLNRFRVNVIIILMFMRFFFLFLLLRILVLLFMKDYCLMGFTNFSGTQFENIPCFCPQFNCSRIILFGKLSLQIFLLCIQIRNFILFFLKLTYDNSMFFLKALVFVFNYFYFILILLWLNSFNKSPSILTSRVMLICSILMLFADFCHRFGLDQLTAEFIEHFFKRKDVLLIFLINRNMPAIFDFLLNIWLLHETHQLMTFDPLISFIFDLFQHPFLQSYIFDQFLDEFTLHLFHVFRLLLLKLIDHLIIDILQFVTVFSDLLDQ